MLGSVFTVETVLILVHLLQIEGDGQLGSDISSVCVFLRCPHFVSHYGPYRSVSLSLMIDRSSCRSDHPAVPVHIVSSERRLRNKIPGSRGF